MSKLPNADRAIVPEAKVTRYLLDETHEHGQSKAQYFKAFGFTIEAWDVFAEAVRLHAVTHDVTATRETTFGIHYVVEGALTTPDGRSPYIRTVWKLSDGVPTLITAYPVEEPTDT